MNPTVLHADVSTSRQDDAKTSKYVDSSTRRWQRLGLNLFACVNAASVGTFFVVFVGLIAFPPEPRNALFLLAVGSFALAVLIMGQFIYWSRLALRSIRERR